MKRTLLALVASSALVGVPAIAQCAIPDGLNGPCCALVTENLPTFPAFTNPGSALGWINCQLLPKGPVTHVMGSPTQLACGAYTAPFSVVGGGFTIVTATLELDYSRTWEEVDPAGNLHQVWRFLAMGDFFMTSPPFPPFPLPPSTDPDAFYHGYVDYAFDCGTGAWEQSFVLQHNCDKFVHDPLWSFAPGAFHPASTYAFVAPDTAAQPFSAALTIPPVAGPTAGGAFRNPAPFAGPAVCNAREPISAPQLSVLGVGCVCPLSLTLPPQNAASSLVAFGGCGSGAISLDVQSVGLPWFHLISTSIGTWTSPFSYPGREAALVYEGPLFYHDACAAQNYVELHYGAATIDGWIRTDSSGVVLPRQLLDLRSNWSAAIPGVVPLPLMGIVFPAPGTRHHVYMDHL